MVLLWAIGFAACTIAAEYAAELLFFSLCLFMGKITQEVALREMRFFAPIGYYEEEQLLGNEFYVDLIVTFPFQSANSEDLNNTVNYEELFQILQAVMRPKRKLLESAAEEVLNALRLKYPLLSKIYISIRKTTPPFGWDSLSSAVSLTYET